jgi:hypothetical protein
MKTWLLKTRPRIVQTLHAKNISSLNSYALLLIYFFYCITSLLVVHFIECRLYILYILYRLHPRLDVLIGDRNNSTVREKYSFSEQRKSILHKNSDVRILWEIMSVKLWEVTFVQITLMWDPWWAKLRWSRFLSSSFGFLLLNVLTSLFRI